jgi:hypothetical protein
MTHDRYVIFKNGRMEGRSFSEELYISADQAKKSELSGLLNLMEITENEDEAMHFPTARAAYDWAGKHKELDWWKVGAR